MIKGCKHKHFFLLNSKTKKRTETKYETAKMSPKFWYSYLALLTHFTFRRKKQKKVDFVRKQTEN